MNDADKLAIRKEREAREHETREYIRNMLGELRNMARAERMGVLAYLIEMAYVEAGDIMRGERPARVIAKKPGSVGEQRAA